MPDDEDARPGDPAAQIQWGRQYINDKYGTPDDTEAADWYRHGGTLPRGLVGARNDTPQPEPDVTCAGGMQLPTIGATDGE